MGNIEDYADGSPAFEVYRLNVRRIDQLLEDRAVAVRKDHEDFSNLSPLVRASVEEAITKVKTASHDERKAAIDLVLHEIQPMLDSAAKGASLLRSISFFLGWLKVMLVTFAEAYLQDAIDALATKGLSSSSLTDELQRKLKKMLTKEISRQTPTQWVAHFGLLGLSGYDHATMLELNSVWAERHEIVHSPRADATTNAPDFERALKLVTAFIISTDKQVVHLLSESAS